LIGTDVNGTVALGNSGSGVAIAGDAHFNRVQTARLQGCDVHAA
jgi:hypothetical protein